MRSSRKLFTLLIIIIFNLQAYGQGLPKQLQKLALKPDYIEVINELEINLKGGHLQGLQGYHWQQEEYVYWSGSSDSYAYLVTGKLSNNIETTRLHRLSEKPLKHAGGFQIYQNWLAIGVEDNEARDRSQVHIYQLNNPNEPLPAPVAVIDRHGPFEKMTAGCVAVVQQENELLVAVGNWNTRNLDFYEASLQGQDYDFIKTGAIEVAALSRKNWSDTTWRSYQNINFYQEEDQLYLLGFASENPARDVMDIFSVETSEGHQYKLRKIGTRFFASSPETSFRWGAGIWIKDHSISVVSCTEKLKINSRISKYHLKTP